MCWTNGVSAVARDLEMGWFHTFQGLKSIIESVAGRYVLCRAKDVYVLSRSLCLSLSRRLSVKEITSYVAHRSVLNSHKYKGIKYPFWVAYVHTSAYEPDVPHTHNKLCAKNFPKTPTTR